MGNNVSCSVLQNVHWSCWIDIQFWNVFYLCKVLNFCFPLIERIWSKAPVLSSGEGWLTCEQALRGVLAAGRELNESLQLRLWNLNISNEKIDAKCWLEDMIIGMASLLLARVFQCLFTFTFDFASPSRWLAEIWQLTRSGFTEW